MTGEVFFATARRSFHSALLTPVLGVDSKGIPSNADKHSKLSVSIATGIVDYLELAFPRLAHLRPGRWEISKGVGGRARPSHDSPSTSTWLLWMPPPRQTPNCPLPSEATT